MTKAAALALAGALLLSGCSPSLRATERNRVMQRILPSTVQLRAEREGGPRRSASGIVIASDAPSSRSWILTTRHFLDPPARQEVYLSSRERGGRIKAQVVAVSTGPDLAVLEVAGLSLPPVTLQGITRLGDEVWVTAYPWGRRLTVVSGVISQLVADEGELVTEGIPRMVDASVSYGASGGGVFDAGSGALVAIVEGYRTAHIPLPNSPDQVIQMPVPGETTVIAVQTIVQFLKASGLERLLPR